MAIEGKYIAKEGRYLLTESETEEAWSNNLHEALAQVMMDHFGKKYKIYMDTPTDFGRSVNFAASAGLIDYNRREDFVVVLQLTYLRRDQDD